MVEAFVVGFNVEGEGIFSEGHVFEPMSYSKLCETVAFESCRMGAPALEYRFSLQESIPPWAFCLTVGVGQGQELFGDARILFPCPKGVNR